MTAYNYIAELLDNEHTPDQILAMINKSAPGLRKKIEKLLIGGWNSTQILSWLGKNKEAEKELPKNFKPVSPEDIAKLAIYKGKTGAEQGQDQQTLSQLQKTSGHLINGAMLLGGLYAGGRALGMLGRKAIPTIYPEVLPAQRALGYQAPKQLLGPQRGMLPGPGQVPPISPRGGPRPGPAAPTAPVMRPAGRPLQTPPVIQQGGPPAVAAQQAPRVSGGQILQNLGLMATLSNLARNNPQLSPQDLAGVLRSVEPAKVQTLLKDKSVNFPQIVEEAVQELQTQPQQQAQQGTANVPEMAEQPQELAPMEQPEEQLPEPMQTQEVAQREPIKATLPVSAKEKIESSTFAPAFLKKLSDHDISKYHFAIPTYKVPNESPVDFQNRLIIESAIEKAAKALEEGKTFLDFPEPWGRSETTEKTISRGPRKGVVERETKRLGQFAPSVAADVLRYMAGVPNVFESLLDDEEKNEINESVNLGESQQMGGLFDSFTRSQSRLPPGEGNIYGAQMTPNLVWNLLLSVEPKLQELDKPKSVKGYKTSPGGKMGTTELRRFLTHAVYGALSGKTISTQLADKIQKISRAAMALDTLAEASKQGKMNAIIEEQEKLLNDDEYFYSLFTEEVEEQAKGIK